MATAGRHAAAIAEELGISRQRVYQLAARGNITLPRPPDVSWSRPRPPKARIITGGVPVAINATVAGTIAELLVAADLMARGWQPYFPVSRHGGHDIVAVADRIVSIEVRSGHRGATGNLVFGRSLRDRSDYYAIVITGEPVVYRPELPDVTSAGKR